MTHAAHEPIDSLLAQSRWVVRFAHALTHEADDAAQDAWVAALGHRERASEQPRAWFATVVRNGLRKRHRSDQRRRQREEDAPDLRKAETPAQLVERVQIERLLAQLVLELPEDHRTVILLHYVEGLSIAEVARRLDLPATTVQSRKQRALATLRERLDDESDGDRDAWRLALAPIAGRITNPTGLGTSRVLGGKALLTSLAVVTAVAAIAALVVLTRSSDVLAPEHPKHAPTTPVSHSTLRASQDGAGGPAASPGALASARCHIEGRVESDADASLTGGRILVRTPSDPEPTAVNLAPDGAFSIEVPSASEVYLGFGAENHAGAERTIAAGCGDPLDVQLTSGALPVSGVVVDSLGGVVSQAVVGLGNVGPGNSVLPDWTDAQGRFRLWALPGEYVAQAMHPAYASAESQLIVTDGVPSMELELVPAGAIHGVVVDHAGSPLQDVEVRAADTLSAFACGGERCRTTSDASGRFELDGLAPGTYTIAAAGPAGLVNAVDVELVLGGAADIKTGLTLTMTQGIVARGRVVDRRGNPIGFANVEALDPGRGRPGATTLTDQAGRFALSVAPGTYSFRASHTTSMGYAMSLNLPADNDRIEIKLGPARTGEVKPPRVAMVVAGDDSLLKNGLHSSSAMQAKHASLSNAQGRFHLYGVGVADRIVAVTPDGLIGSAPIRGGASTHIELSLSSRITGTALRDGRPLAGVQVVATVGSDERLGPVTAQDGSFWWVGLPPGNVSLEFLELDERGAVVASVKSAIEVPDGETLDMAPVTFSP